MVFVRGKGLAHTHTHTHTHAHTHTQKNDSAPRKEERKKAHRDLKFSSKAGRLFYTIIMKQCKNHCVLVFEDISLNAQLEFLVSQEL